MKIACPACSAKYSIADEKVQNRLAKIRCRKCGTTIVIDGKVAPPSVYAADQGAVPGGAAPGGGGTEYSVDFGDNDQRTLSVSDLVTAYNAGQVTAETYVWADGMADWTALGEVPEIVDALNAAATSASSSPQPTTSSPWEAAAPSPSAARSGGRSGGSDLFGGFDAAGSEEDVMTSAPGDAGPASGGPAPTGARNESSVLFSLSALTASRQSEPPAKASSSTKDDSGLIDLKALTAEARPDAGGAAAFGASFGAPLGMAAPLGGTAAEAIQAPTAEPQQKSKTGIFIGGAVFAAALVIGLAIVLKPAAPVPEAPKAAAEPAALPAAPAEPQPTATAKPPSTGTAEPEAEKPPAAAKSGGAAPAGAARKPGGKSAAKPEAGEERSTAKPAAKPEAGEKPAAKPASKPSKCSCKPGDLMCAMRCAASKK